MDEYKIRVIVKEALEEFFGRFENDGMLLTEMSINRDVFVDKLGEKLRPTLDNILCILIYHDINQDVLDHWCNRATDLCSAFFGRKIKKETVKLRDSAVREAFSKEFGEGYCELNGKSYVKPLITHYGRRVEKDKQMYAKLQPDEYINIYRDEISLIMNKLKIALIEGDYDQWKDDMIEFTNKYRC